MFFEAPRVPFAVLAIAQCCLALGMLLAGWRLLKGPSLPDRIVALDLIGALLMAEAALMVFASGFVSYLDVAAAVAIVSFLATVAFARCLERGGEK